MNDNNGGKKVGMLTEQGDLGLGFTVLEGTSRQTIVDELVNKEKDTKKNK